MKKEKKYNEIEIYKAYLEARGTKGYSVIKLSKKLGVPRATLYSIVKRIEKGDEIQLSRCTDKSKYDCIWKYRYQSRFLILDENNKKYSEILGSIIYEMKCDGFGLRDIARRVCKDVSTVSYHLEKYKY